MITANNNIINAINSPVRKIQARVELYEGSTLVNTYSYDDALVSLSIERTGEESKFFGFGIIQKLNLKLIDINREINISTANSFKVMFGVENEYIYVLPSFNVTYVTRDENTNELSITAYDMLYAATEKTIADITLTSYTVEEFAAACVGVIGATGYEIQNVGETETCFDTYFENGANFNGNETIREALNNVADATQTIYFLNNENKVIFKRLDKNGAVALQINKSRYFTLESSNSRRLATIVSATELGDNLSASTITTGSTQYVRNNAFWDLREDRATLVENAVAAVGGLTINQFEASWRGNFLLEIGDKIELTTKDNKNVVSYVLDDSIEYNGTLVEKTRWHYEESDAESSNSTSLGESLKQAYAKVDKINKEIELVINEVEGYDERLSQIQMDIDSIDATVKDVEDKVSATITSEDVAIEVSKQLQDGVNSVTTTTGFTFNEEGLTVSKSGVEMSTTVTEDGMTVNRGAEELLVANNTGVTAVNLHATTYLIIGDNSRFEDYVRDGEPRTGCFWIGGA